MTKPPLDILAEHRNDLLKAELGALLHNLGKVSQEFIDSRVANPRASFAYQLIAGTIRDRIPAVLDSKNQTRAEFFLDRPGLEFFASEDDLQPKFLSDDMRELLRQEIDLPYPLNDRTYKIGDLIELQHAGWYGTRGHRPWLLDQLELSPSWATRLLQRSHHNASGSDKDGPNFVGVEPKPSTVSIASAYGAERVVANHDFAADRTTLMNQAIDYHKTLSQSSSVDDLKTSRRAVFDIAPETLGNGVGDTQRAINDVTAWDLGASVAALYKAGAARLILDPPATSADMNTTLMDLSWRFLSVRLDGLAFMANIHHVTDLMGRKRVLDEALNRVRNVLEVEFPLANEVYRDENGSVFIAPDLEDLLDLNLTIRNESEPQRSVTMSLENRLRAGFKGSRAADIGGEVMLSLVPTPESYREMSLRLTSALGALPPLSAQPEAVARWWQGASNAQICTVCQVRPQGPSTSVAGQRNMCDPCFERRKGRSQDWYRQRERSTIWTDEAADINGKLALVCGRFDLDEWLSGNLVKTLNLGTQAMFGTKNPSFARARRVWETTSRFWDDIEALLDREGDATSDCVIPSIPVRLLIRGKFEGGTAPEKFAVYEIQVHGATLAVVWDRESKSFISVSNLSYLAKQLGADKETFESVEASADYVIGRLQGTRTLSIDQAGGYNESTKPIGRFTVAVIETEQKAYTPAIPLLAEPRLFMGIVPANRAMALVERINCIYDKRMSRVRNRLRLDVGVVYFDRRTPIPAVLDAGRRMLTMPTQAVVWTVGEVVRDPKVVTVRFQEWDGEWCFPATMDIDSEPDIWYPWFTRADNSDHEPLPPKPSDLEHVSDLKKNQRVWVRPSRFDFEYLETAGRRLGIAYDDDGRRLDLSRQQRPYMREDVARLARVWNSLPGVAAEKPATTQIYQLIHLVESSRSDWGEPIHQGHSDPFRQFVADATAQMDTTAWWCDLCEEDRQVLVQAGIEGWLTDALYLAKFGPLGSNSTATWQGDDRGNP